MTIVVKEYARKPSFVQAIQVTEFNMHDVAEWCDGVIKNDTPGGKNYIKVKVFNPNKVRQTQAFADDWVIRVSSKNYKVFTHSAFNNSFNPAFVEEQKLLEAGTPMFDEIRLQHETDPNLAQRLLRDGIVNAPARPSNPSSRKTPPAGFAVGANTGVFERYQRGELNPHPPVFQNLPQGPDAEWPVQLPQDWSDVEIAKFNYAIQEKSITVTQAWDIMYMSPEDRARYLAGSPMPPKPAEDLVTEGPQFEGGSLDVETGKFVE
jgi:hypothetical protein